MPVEVRRYGERTWAVYFGGELLCVTAYLRGARAVQALIGRMQEELNRVEGRAGMDADAVEGVEVVG